MFQKPNKTVVPDTTNLARLDLYLNFDFKMSLKVKSNGTKWKPIWNFLYGGNKNISICNRFHVTCTPKSGLQTKNCLKMRLDFRVSRDLDFDLDL